MICNNLVNHGIFEALEEKLLNKKISALDMNKANQQKHTFHDSSRFKIEISNSPV